MTDRPEYGWKSENISRGCTCVWNARTCTYLIDPDCPEHHMFKVPSAEDLNPEVYIPNPTPGPRALYGLALVILAVMLGFAAIILAARW